MAAAAGIMLVLYGSARVELGVFAHPTTGASISGLWVQGRHETIDRSLVRFFPSDDAPYILELDTPVSFVHTRENSEFTMSSRGLATPHFGVLISGNAKINLGDASFDVLNATVLGNGGLTGIGSVGTSTMSANGSAQISGFCVLKELLDGCDPTASIRVCARPGVKARSRYTKLTIQQDLL